jgi:hypothetical protein
MVMMDATDMSTPVTRGELREELAQLATKAELAQLATKAELAQLATKVDLWGGALVARIQSGERFMERLLERIDSSEQRLLAELARHTKASAEAMVAQISIIDEKYADLPLRMSRLEAEVFRGKRR